MTLAQAWAITEVDVLRGTRPCAHEFAWSSMVIEAKALVAKAAAKASDATAASETLDEVTVEDES